MDSRRAKYLLAVIDHGSFSAAARSLHLSQPALSTAVKELEESVGIPLLDRLGRHVLPSAAGRAIEPHLRRSLAELDIGFEAARSVLGLEGGTLRICCLPTLATDPVADAVGRLRAAHPGVSVEILDPEDHDSLVEMVSSGRAELGLATSAGSFGSLVAVRAGSQRLKVIFPAASSVKGDLSLEELVRHDLVAFPPGTSTRQVLDEALDRVGLSARVAVEVAQRDAVIPLVLAGAGAALVPAPLAEVAHARGAVMRDLVDPLERELTLLRRDAPPSPAAAFFADLLLGS